MKFAATVAGLLVLAAHADPPSRIRVTTIDGETVECDGLVIDDHHAVTLDAARSPDVPAAGSAPFARTLTLDDLLTIQPLHTATDRAASNLPPASHPASRPVPEWRFYPAAGGLFRGNLMETSAAAEPVLAIDVGLDQPIRLPLSALAAVQFQPVLAADAAAELQRRLASHERLRDYLLVPSDQGLRSFAGVCQQITPRTWSFLVGDRTLRGNVSDAVAIVLARSSKTPSDPPAELHTLDGQVWRGSLERAAPDRVSFLPARAANPTPVPWRRVGRIELRSRRVLFLSDLEPLHTASAGLFGTEWPIGRDRTLSGTPLRLAGRTYPKGLAVHSRTTLTFAVPPGFTRLAAVIGLDPTTGAGGEVRFRVLVREQVLFESDIVTVGSSPREILVNLPAKQEVTLEVDFGDGLDIADHAIWANARLVQTASPATSPLGVQRLDGGPPS